MAGVVEKFYLLKYGMALILLFVGLKMTWFNQDSGGGREIPILWSLGIILFLVTASILASLLFPQKKRRHAHAAHAAHA